MIPDRRVGGASAEPTIAAFAELLPLSKWWVTLRFTHPTTPFLPVPAGVVGWSAGGTHHDCLRTGCRPCRITIDRAVPVVGGDRRMVSEKIKVDTY